MNKLDFKPAVQEIMDSARNFRAAPGDLYDLPYKRLQDLCYEHLMDAYTKGKKECLNDFKIMSNMREM